MYFSVVLFILPFVQLLNSVFSPLYGFTFQFSIVDSNLLAVLLLFMVQFVNFVPNFKREMGVYRTSSR